MSSSIEQIPEHLRHEFDIHDQTISDCVIDELRKLHDKGPITYSTAHGGHWLVTGYDEARKVMTNYELFSSFPNSLPRHPTLPPTIPLEIDPPEHSVYREVIAPLFAPGRMRALEDEIRELTVRLIDDFIDRGEAEIVGEFAHPLPSGMFLSMMGWPWDDLDKFVEWTDAIITTKQGLTDEQRFELRANAVAQYSAYFQEVIDAARDDTSGSITATIVQTRREDGKTISDAELVNMFGLLMIAGLHTVRGVVANAIIDLAGNDEVRRSLAENPDQIPTFVEEMLRMHSPASVGRRVTEDTELSGVQMRAGDRLIVSVPFANYDEKQFERPFDMVYDRETNRHLAFAVGPHRCAGSHLARVELKVAIEEILRRIPEFTLVGTPRFHAGQVKGVSEVRIAFDPPAARNA